MYKTDIKQIVRGSRKQMKDGNVFYGKHKVKSKLKQESWDDD